MVWPIKPEITSRTGCYGRAVCKSTHCLGSRSLRDRHALLSCWGANGVAGSNRLGGLCRRRWTIPFNFADHNPITWKSLSAGHLTANTLFQEPAECAKSVRDECGKNEGKKGDCQSNHADRTFERKSDTHSDPCCQAHWTGI